MKKLTKNQKIIDVFSNKEDMTNIRPNRDDGDHVLSHIAILLMKNRIKQLMTCKWYESEKEEELMPSLQLPRSKQLNKLIKNI
jgi:hypothetical protein